MSGLSAPSMSQAKEELTVSSQFFHACAEEERFLSTERDRRGMNYVRGEQVVLMQFYGNKQLHL